MIRNIFITTLVAVAMLFCGLTAEAQRYYRPRYDLGVTAGATVSSQEFSPSIEQQMFPGFTGGFKFRYSEEKLFGLLAELNISQRGWKEKFDEPGFEYQRRLTYLELPVMTHINFGTRVFRGFVNLGPYVSYMIGSSINSNFNYADPGSEPGFSMSNRHVNQMKMDVSNKFDYGIVGGAGIELIIKRRHSIMLEFRYDFGLANIFPAAKKDEFSSSRGTAMQLTLGYLYRLK